MQIKRKLTEVAVDSFTDYLKEKLEDLKKLDLDKDGQKDVDQVVEILKRCGRLSKDALAATDLPAVAGGLEQIITGATAIGKAVNTEKLGAAAKELGQAFKKLANLAHLGIVELKEREK